MFDVLFPEKEVKKPTIMVDAGTQTDEQPTWTCKCSSCNKRFVSNIMNTDFCDECMLDEGFFKTE